jgi:hypothetical protein
VTDLLPAPCTESEARALTDSIKESAEQTWALLYEAHERQAWSVLGYSTWASYVEAEFGMSKNYANRLVNQADVIYAIEAATGVVPSGTTLTEAETRDLKPVLSEVTDAIREAVTDAEPEEAAEIARDVVNTVRKRVVAQRSERKEADQLSEAAERYPFLADVPAKPSEVIATANGLDGYEGAEKERRIGNAEKWAEMKRRNSGNPRQRPKSELAEQAVGNLLSNLVSWNVDAGRAIDLWDEVVTDPAMEGEWEAAIRLARGYLDELQHKNEGRAGLRRIK